MKLGRSLSSRILLVAFLNVALLALVFLVFARVQFRFELGSVLLAPVRERMLSVSRRIALDLPSLERGAWSRLLASYSKTYPADFYLFDSGGQELAGPAAHLPAEVISALRRDPFAHERGDEGPPPEPLERGPQFGRGLDFSQPPTDISRLDRGRNLDVGREPDFGPEPNYGPGLRSTVVVQSSNPSQHWIICRIPVFVMGSSKHLHGSVVLRMRSLWLTQFFDPRPWIAVALIAALVSVFCWLPLIRGLTRSIGQLTRVTGQIAEGSFDVELPRHRRDELGQLSESIHRMAQRLSGFVHGQKRFLGDIAHELCAPIARIQVALGILEQRAGENEIDYVVDLKAEVDHMSSLVNELLSFSKAQLKTGVHLAEVNVAETLQRVVQRESNESVQIDTQVSERLNVMGQPDYLFRSLANVIRNAIRYAGDAGPITVSARNGNGMVAIVVADNGPGVPESELDEIFKPFYRPEFARTRETGGTGLGLAIVKSCIESCGGTVVCRNRAPKGFEVEMRLIAAS